MQRDILISSNPHPERLMSENHLKNENEKASEFDALSKEKSKSFAVEFLLFLKNNKKWWMLPIILVLALLGVLAILSTTGAAPFIYPLF